MPSAADLTRVGLRHKRVGDYERALDVHPRRAWPGAGHRPHHRRPPCGRHCARQSRVCYYILGRYGQAFDLHGQALAIVRGFGDRHSESFILDSLAKCLYVFGNYEQATGLDGQALAIARDIGDRGGEANALVSLGLIWLASYDSHRAYTMLKQAAHVAALTGDVEAGMRTRLGLARIQLELNEPTTVLAMTAAHRNLTYPPAAPTLWLLEGIAQLELRHPEEGARAFYRRSYHCEGVTGTRRHQRCCAGILCARAERTRGGHRQPTTSG